MKKFKGYEKAKVITSTERLPANGYVCKILSAEEQGFINGGTGLKISFDIAEGEFKDFFKSNYQSQQQEDKKWKGNIVIYVPKSDGSEMDGWTADKFKTSMDAIETSNKGYHWDWNESKLKDKIIGVLFHDKEYEFNGSRGFFTASHSLRNIEQIRSGKFKVPKAKMLNKASISIAKTDDFDELVSDDDLPF